MSLRTKLGLPAISVGLIALTYTFAGMTACDTGGDASPSPTICAEIAVAANGLFPGDGEQFAYNGNPVIVGLNIRAAAGAAITLKEQASGTEVAGSSMLSEDGKTVIFTPDARLSPTTMYDATVNASEAGGCNDISVSWSFRTSDAGTPMGDEQQALDKTYALDLGGAVFIEPPGVGALLGQFLNFPLFVHVAAITPSEVTFTGGIGDEGATEQDYCTQTLTFDPAGFTDPDFAFTGDFTIAVEGIEVTISDMELTGTFKSDASEILGARLKGGLDTRGLEGLLDDQGDPCELLQTVAGISCVACADGVEACITLDAININGGESNTAAWAAGQWVDIAENQAENHLCGDCADGEDGDGDGDIDNTGGTIPGDTDDDGTLEDTECDNTLWP